MADKEYQVGKVKVIFTRSSRLLKIIVAVLVVLSVAALVALNFVSDSILNRTQDLRNEQAAVEHANEVLEHKMDTIKSQDTIEQIAREDLGLVKPDTIIITPEN